MNNFKTVSPAVVLIFLSLSCSTKQFPDSHFAACYPNHPYDTISFQWSNPPDTLMTKLGRYYPRYYLLVANSAGLLPLLSEHERAKQRFAGDASQVNRVDVLALREKILNRISFFRAQVAAVAAELDCEGERADQSGSFLDRLDRQSITNYTVASIVTAAAAGVVAASIDNNDAKGVAIVGGIGSAALSLLSLSSNHKIYFKHPRNLLKDIWLLPAHSSDFPSMVWNMLSRNVFSNSGEFSVAQNMKKGWQGYWQLNPSKRKADKKIKLLMGDGGLYTADDLKLRANMINMLQASVKLIDQDIQGLLSEVNKGN